MISRSTSRQRTAHLRRSSRALLGPACLRLSRLRRGPSTRESGPIGASRRQLEPVTKGEGIRARKWILVAEDDRSIRLLLGRVLTAVGYSVLTAEDGVEALDLTKELLPHLILLDLRMPRLSGVEFLARSRGVPIVVLSGFLGDLPDEVASQANVVARLEKPVSLDVLRLTVERVLGR